ncbi:MAG: ethylbenzene dehydrogenase-related protein [bacterium]|nr:ethylbenzene dehydrogenase-related protein [bacterium]
MRRIAYPAAVLVVLALLATVGLSHGVAAAQSTAEVVAVQRDVLPAHPDDNAAWRAAPTHVVPLMPQNLVEPRLMEASTKEVRVQAITDGRRVAFRLAWVDATQDDLPGVKRYTDACAVMLPPDAKAPVPSPMMGSAGTPVEITYWSAYWQAAIDGRGDTIKDIYPGAAVDHYPFEAPSLKPGSKAQHDMMLRYAPARAVGNRRVGPRARPVEDLIAEGPGTISRATAPKSDGNGRRTDEGWAVVISRPNPKGLNSKGVSKVQFAVWNGSHGEVGSRKMWSGWVPFRIKEGR